MVRDLQRRCIGRKRAAARLATSKSKGLTWAAGSSEIVKKMDSKKVDKTSGFECSASTRREAE
ncbi:hypothetical protein I6N96_16680 [Enterococcus sp. BWM-S5]|uniref:Uncharacterized protein n=1 Tax=Enterococcus larvae TaxID=2794352 RepID=A0ABS4CMV5_9ENTE|nr:hypothetical protein [Enterococcus larvae]MBP1047927.1 hypothetical protein [Enterococcus larvae]